MIIFFGGPLLDIIVYVDEMFLSKYNLKPDDAVTAVPELEGIFEEIFAFDPILQPGGSNTNSARVFQWISRKSYPVMFAGCIGTDHFGGIIKDRLAEEEINCYLVEVQNVRTGTCAVLLTGEDRSMVTYLGATKCFSASNLDESFLKHVQKAEYFYLSAFFLGVSFEVVEKLFMYLRERKKYIIINLGASFLCSKYPKQITYLFQNADIVFGNESEYRAFTNIPGLQNPNTQELLPNLNRLYNNKPSRLLIMTRGYKTIFILQDGKQKEYKTLPVCKEEVIDTDGAGDAFAGGFLAQFVKHRSIADCVKCGTWAAREIIKQHGCNFEKNKLYSS